MIKCLKCNSTNLVYYTEEVKAYEQRITKRNTIEKRRKLADHNYLEPQHIMCKNCGERFDFVTDNFSKIVKLISNN